MSGRKVALRFNTSVLLVVVWCSLLGGISQSNAFIQYQKKKPFRGRNSVANRVRGIKGSIFFPYPRKLAFLAQAPVCKLPPFHQSRRTHTQIKMDSHHTHKKQCTKGNSGLFCSSPSVFQEKISLNAGNYVQVNRGEKTCTCAWANMQSNQQQKGKSKQHEKASALFTSKARTLKWIIVSEKRGEIIVD